MASSQALSCQILCGQDPRSLEWAVEAGRIALDCRDSCCSITLMCSHPNRSLRARLFMFSSYKYEACLTYSSASPFYILQAHIPGRCYLSPATSPQFKELDVGPSNVLPPVVDLVDLFSTISILTGIAAVEPSIELVDLDEIPIHIWYENIIDRSPWAGIVSTAIYCYKPKKLLEERVLKLVGLSPAPLLVRGSLGPASTSQSLTASTEVGGSNSKEAEVEIADAVEGPNEAKKCKKKHKHRSKSSCSSKSSERNNSRSKLRLGKETVAHTEEEENASLLKELTSWWKEAREGLKCHSCKVAEMEGDELVPD
ncbi:UNVERIFIED_CONTAM: hypothetical protein Slati_3756900 [Sesamum latifolium]|uniref:Uncharacterized protein n=1 Tax=Sesamum latifolium TaxID=2727402 RepID=A0AAW2U468_9LAMI